MNKYADSKLPYLPPRVKVVEFRIERGFLGSCAPVELTFDDLLIRQNEQTQYTEATQSTGWDPTFNE